MLAGIADKLTESFFQILGGGAAMKYIGQRGLTSAPLGGGPGGFLGGATGKNSPRGPTGFGGNPRNKMWDNPEPGFPKTSSSKPRARESSKFGEKGPRIYKPGGKKRQMQEDKDYQRS